ncbi:MULTISPECIES: S8 family peptidase [Niastella]|uniref:S8 family peptidase n=1 Tax=Niastella soli TaxID=2821487 RepID=A0ABS3YUF1_9BACT|nr:S8 family peptidase [Niastella soli]MBO9201510.1 S8 family peptidase [Niastella soli]
MKRIATLVLILIATTGIAQVKMSRYLVELTDKKGTPYTLSDPSAYLSAKSITRRINQTRPFDSTDLPVNPAYIQALRNVPYVIRVINNSKWLNQVLVQIDTTSWITINSALAGINALPFVKKASSVGKRESTNSISNILTNNSVQAPVAVNQEYGPTGSTTAFNYGSMYNQIHIHNADFMHNLGFSGRGMTIAVIDGGFRNYLNNPVFDSVRLQGRILGTWDYVTNEASVNEDIPHGANVLSLLASNWPGVLVGTAPHASYYLLRTENDTTEYPVEEQNWAVAAEFADSAGVDMISTSLGYNHFDDASYDHSYAQRNGNTSMITRAADLAAKKGILVVVAAGNDGRLSDDTKYISCPADADSVLTIGSIDVNGNIASSSSWGPNGAGLLKPNVVAVGENAVITNYITGLPYSGSGTSYACPNMAGMVACLWQMFPELSNMQVINAVQQSASKSANPDFRFGYGIPNFKKAIPLLTKQFASASVEFNNCIVSVSWKSKDDTSSVYTLQRKLPGETGYSTLSQINAASGAFTTKSYNYNDTLKTAGAGPMQYRILQTMRSVDTTIEIANLQQNNTAVCFPDNTLMVMPSPFDQQLLVVLNTPEAIPNMGIKITDMMGRVMFTQKANKPAGYFSTSVITTGWNTGIYEVTLYNNDKRMYGRKVLKK